MVADEFPEMDVVSPQTMGGPSTVLHLYTEDVDALWARAVDAGAQALYPLQDQFWGDRHGQLTDPFGHRWALPCTCATSRPRRSPAPSCGVRWLVKSTLLGGLRS
jgi:uncharacterized glyoxalase superfamily protein PhnB